MDFASLDELDPGRKYSGVPERLLNGGLYTGEALQPPWAVAPVVPTTTAFMSELHSPEIPQKSWHLPGGFTRPGNNEVDSSQVVPLHNGSHVFCAARRS